MQWLFMEKRGQGRGFALVELLVVIVVLAVLAAIVLPRFMDSCTRSKESLLKSDLELIRSGLSAFHADTGKYPATLADLAKTDKTTVRTAGGNRVNNDDWQGPYLEAVPNDPMAEMAFTYNKESGKVTSSANGTSLDGSPYSSW